MRLYILYENNKDTALFLAFFEGQLDFLTAQIMVSFDLLFCGSEPFNSAKIFTMIEIVFMAGGHP